jgi:predicted dehydrogenase
MIPGHLRFADKPKRVTEPFHFAAVGLEHGHIDALCRRLREAGGTLTHVFDPDPEKVTKFCANHPGVVSVEGLEQILEDPKILLVCGAVIPEDRAALGCLVMKAGKDYCTIKPPFTTLDQVAQARAISLETGRKYSVFFIERTQVESAIYASQVIQHGLIGKVVNYVGLGPHRLNPAGRPAWFWDKKRSGGILGDIGIHHVEQFFHFTGCQSVKITASSVGNVAYPERPDFEDFGEASFAAEDLPATGYCRVDWLTPKGLRTWGDGRVTILGTKGYMELRKYLDPGRSSEMDHVLLVTESGEDLFSVQGEVGFPFFSGLIRDCLDRTETVMTQDYIFRVAEATLQSQKQAVWVS